MKAETQLPSGLRGLTHQQVEAARRRHGKNVLSGKRPNTWKTIALDLAREPMLILLLLISGIYFILGNYGEAYFMLSAIVIVSGISFYQDNRSRKAMEAIRTLTAPTSTVIRSGQVVIVPSEDVVPGDLLRIEEGNLINADGRIVYSHDFSVNESTFTGEAQPVIKSAILPDSTLFSGTLVSTGMAVMEVTATGNETKLGKLGASLRDIRDERSPLQKQIESFVGRMSLAGFVVFVVICVVSYVRSKDVLDSLLRGLTLAMSILPEELPVAFTTFLALGSRRLISQGVLVKRTRTVETLGAATVICTDKTGTITENRMELNGVYAWRERKFENQPGDFTAPSKDVIAAAMWASEPSPFDPMEQAIHQCYSAAVIPDQRQAYNMVHEYPLGGIPPMMTHVFENENGHRIIAAKGAPEAFLHIAGLSDTEQQELQQIIDQLASKGLRLLGVAVVQDLPVQYPDAQQKFHFTLLGLLAFSDPPKENIREVISQFGKAGIEVKIITGDNLITTSAIARQAGLPFADNVTTGAALAAADTGAAKQMIADNAIFTRMHPEAKLMVVRELKRSGQVVAMIGDGVNDAPALKASDIGVAMGIRGTEVARQAADMILLRDDLQGLVTAVEHGRRIYANLKKAVQYIIAIHIPIILTVSLPLVLGWIYPAIFTPAHVIFLELIMGPTCSVVFENEKAERNSMLVPPRPVQYSFLNWREMGRSIVQGIMITAGVLCAFQIGAGENMGESGTRTMVFTTLVMANILLTLVSRSTQYSWLESARTSNPLMAGILLVSSAVLALMLYVHPVQQFFGLQSISPGSLVICFGLAFVSVFWYEVWKWYVRFRLNRGKRG